jgi:hypothetical protein
MFNIDFVEFANWNAWFETLIFRYKCKLVLLVGISLEFNLRVFEKN